MTTPPTTTVSTTTMTFSSMTMTNTVSTSKTTSSARPTQDTTPKSSEESEVSDYDSEENVGFIEPGSDDSDFEHRYSHFIVIDSRDNLVSNYIVKTSLFDSLDNDV